MGNITIPAWKAVLTDKVVDYAGSSPLLIKTAHNADDKKAVYQALRYLPGYAKVSEATYFDGGVMLKFEGKNFFEQQRNGNALISDLEAVQEEVEALREAEEEAAGESGQFVNPQTPNPTVTVDPVGTPTTTSTVAIVQETIEKYDAKTILFWGLVITALILIFKK